MAINREALRAHLLKDGRLGSVDLEIAAPGESCRMGIIFDIVKPCAKEPGTVTDVPGILKLIALAGF